VRTRENRDRAASIIGRFDPEVTAIDLVAQGYDIPHSGTGGGRAASNIRHPSSATVEAGNDKPGSASH